MQKATDNQQNAHYNDEVLFLDGILEFHPNVYAELSDGDRHILRTYYLIGNKSVPENIFDYRDEVVIRHPGIDEKARAVFQKILRALNVGDFRYTTHHKV